MPDVSKSGNGDGGPGGLRERKRKATLERITQAALRLFAANGYEATTVDAIAAASGISRRTFFHYFKSKDDILLSLQTGPGQVLADALEREPNGPPLPILRNAMLKIVASYPADELIAIDRLMLSSEAVQARKQASYLQDEAILFTALRAHWPEEEETALRLLAMLCIGVTRLAMEAWRRDGSQRPLAEYLKAQFEAMEVFKQL